MLRLITRSTAVCSMIPPKLQSMLIMMAKMVTTMLIPLIKRLLIQRKRKRSIMLKMLRFFILRSMPLSMNRIMINLLIRLLGIIKNHTRLMFTMIKSMAKDIVIQSIKLFPLTKWLNNFMILSILMTQQLMSRLLLIRLQLMSMRNLMWQPSQLMSIID